MGTPINGDAIYNGALDNASGVASLLEIARTLREGTVKPRRSILFAIVTAEEKGLLGSSSFARRPTAPQKAMVAGRNFDMTLPKFPRTRRTPGGTATRPPGKNNDAGRRGGGEGKEEKGRVDIGSGQH